MIRIVLICLMSFAIAGCIRSGKTVTPRGAAAVAQSSGGFSAAALTEVNALRAAAGQAALADDARLARAAQVHAADMARSGVFSHSGSDGSSVGDRVKRQGYGFCFVAENIAQGQRNLAEALTAWRTSEGHRKNMLSPYATQLGLARSDRGDYWVMVLGKPGC